MTRLKISFGLAILCIAPIAAGADNISDDLNSSYQNHILGVRFPIHDGDQEFDSDGHSTNAGATPEWELYGGILVDKVRLKNDRLHVEGTRVAPSGRVENGKPVLILLGKKLNFDIHLERPLTSMDEARKILGSVFYLEEKDAEHRKPELRRTRDSTNNQKADHTTTGNGVPRGYGAPRALYTPEPEYSEPARKAKFQGLETLSVVIDTNGTISDMKIERGLGLGLDEQSFECLKKWRFAPATRNGEPVEVHLRMELDFHLY